MHHYGEGPKNIDLRMPGAVPEIQQIQSQNNSHGQSLSQSDAAWHSGSHQGPLTIYLALHIVYNTVFFSRLCLALRDSNLQPSLDSILTALLGRQVNKNTHTSTQIER